jgi:hypothetical protein
MKVVIPMPYLQIVVNGVVLGALYACLAVGFSLVWGVLNVINMLHGSLIILGGYLTFFAWHSFGINPLLALPSVALVLYAVGYLVQLTVRNGPTLRHISSLSSCIKRPGEAAPLPRPMHRARCDRDATPRRRCPIWARPCPTQTGRLCRPMTMRARRVGTAR